VSPAVRCAALGIAPTVRHADTFGPWLDVLVTTTARSCAPSRASKAADYLLGFLPEEARAAAPVPDSDERMAT